MTDLVTEPVEVEIDIAVGLERLTHAGLPDAAVRASSERQRSAFGSGGLMYPIERFAHTVQLDESNEPVYLVEFGDVKGQEREMRAWETAMLDQNQCI